MIERRGKRLLCTPSKRTAMSLLILAALLWPSTGFGAGSEDDPEGDVQARRSIGLVLSGGGARGLAHVGVLRWFEEHRIPVELVTGTSMGGLVGGLYASGADVDEMVELLDALDWSVVLSAEAPYAQKAFRRKEDARQAPATFELGLRDGFKLPPGIDAGHQVGLVLDRIGFPYSEIDSFDDLPTPFACVSVDLESGQEFVFREGRLAEALRATMSYPGWFIPVYSGDKVLIDGGVLNNLPTDVAIDMGAEVVIAVDLGMRSSEVEPFDNVLGVLNRTLSVLMRTNTDRNAELADHLITPDVSEFGFVDFDHSEDLMRIGYEATSELADELAAYSLDEAAWSAYLRTREERRRVFDAVPEFVEVHGSVDTDTATVAAALDHHIGEPLDPDHLDYDLTNVVGWGRYDVVGYWGTTSEGKVGLGVDMQAKTYGPPFVRPILELRGSEFGEAVLSFGGRFTFYDLAGVNSEWRTDLTYGQSTRAFTELFMPLGTGGFFVAPRAIVGEARHFFYDNGEAAAEYEVVRVGGGGDIGYGFGPRSQLRFGFDMEHQKATVKVGRLPVEPIEGASGTVRAEWMIDGTNSALVATKGMRFGIDAQWVFESPDATGDFYQAEMSWLGSHHLGGRFTLTGAVAGGTTFGGTASPLRQFLLGGPMRMSALAVDEFRGDHFYLGRTGLLWALADENTLSFFGKFWLAAFYEVGDAFDKKSDPFHDVAFGLAGETIMGAVMVGGAIGEDGRGGFFFTVGRLFD